jgi:hypothetical protein
MDWKKGLLRLALASMMLACFPVPEDKEEEDEDEDEERGDDDDDDDDSTPFGGGDDDDDDDDDVVGDDDDDDDEPGYDADCALGADAYCFCWTYYGYAECDDAEWGSYYDMCTTGEDGGVIECYADHVDQDYYIDCYETINTCGG